MKTKQIYTLLLAAILLILPAHQASAAMTPLAIGIIPPVQFPPSKFDIVGLRASVIYGNHRSVSGIDLGLIGNMTEVSFAGLAVAGGFNRNKGKATILGLQLAGIANLNMEKTGVYGLQADSLTTTKPNQMLSAFNSLQPTSQKIRLCTACKPAFGTMLELFTDFRLGL